MATKKKEVTKKIVMTEENGENIYEIVYDNGDRYEGKCCSKREVPHGSGVYYFKTGETYKGEINYGVLSGFAEISLLHNESYIGQYHNNFPNGLGTWFGLNGYRYTGDFKDGIKHGSCIEEMFANGDKFEGIYKNGERKSG